MRLTSFAFAVALVGSLATASASTVIELGPSALEAGADRIVDATVVSRASRWTADHTAIETHAVLAVESTRKGRSGGTVEVVVAGGAIDGAQEIVFGMPSVGVGEHARWFLKARGDGTYRVYGWGQGKWPARVVDGAVRFVQSPVDAERDPGITAFTTNGMVWPASKMPVPYLINNLGSDDLPIDKVIAAFDAAFHTWQAVPTSSLTFVNAGMTDLGQAVDGTNVMLFIESGWTFGSEAAAATSLFIIDGQQTADIAVNGEDFHWAVSPPGAGINSNLLDLQGVMTHEIGHFSGLGHTQRAYDTMYFSWKPWQGQRTLSIDDKLGLSSIYPQMDDECTIGATCAVGEQCVQHPLGKLCEGSPDPIGTPCNFDRVECDSFCLFTAINLSSGYCSKFCESNADCPLTHHCDAASAGSMTVQVCFDGAQPPPEPACSGDDACPAGEHCDVGAGGCTFECREDADCGGGLACDDRGRCVEATGGGGGCQSAGGDSASVLLLCGLGGLLARRRRRRGELASPSWYRLREPISRRRL